MICNISKFKISLICPTIRLFYCNWYGRDNIDKYSIKAYYVPLLGCFTISLIWWRHYRQVVYQSLLCPTIRLFYWKLDMLGDNRWDKYSIKDYCVPLLGCFTVSLIWWRHYRQGVYQSLKPILLGQDIANMDLNLCGYVTQRIIYRIYKICIIEVYVLKYHFISHLIYKWSYYRQTIFNQLNLMGILLVYAIVSQFYEKSMWCSLNVMWGSCASFSSAC